ncbi:MAG: glycosyltransferase family 2 protein [Idiomarina sp.]|nr:glycosyltransferase family 2 protein [Idiomarina sp.]
MNNVIYDNDREFRVSVIVPTCDRPLSYLLEAINSIAAQSFSPTEIIVVDNGNIPVKSESLPSNVDYYRVKKRIGVSKARNFGASMAQGNYISFLDDDDWWDEDFLFHAVEELKSSGSKCVYGQILYWCNGIVSEGKTPSKYTVTPSNLLFRNPGVGGQNLLISKELFFMVEGFDAALKTSEDKSLVMEIIKMDHDISFCSKSLVYLRQHEGERLSNKYFDRLKFIRKYRSSVKRKTFMLAVLFLFTKPFVNMCLALLNKVRVR